MTLLYIISTNIAALVVVVVIPVSWVLRTLVTVVAMAAAGILIGIPFGLDDGDENNTADDPVAPVPVPTPVPDDDPGVLTVTSLNTGTDQHWMNTNGISPDSVVIAAVGPPLTELGQEVVSLYLLNENQQYTLKTSYDDSPGDGQSLFSVSDTTIFCYKTDLTLSARSYTVVDGVISLGSFNSITIFPDSINYREVGFGNVDPYTGNVFLNFTSTIDANCYSQSYNKDLQPKQRLDFPGYIGTGASLITDITDTCLLVRLAAAADVNAVGIQVMSRTTPQENWAVESEFQQMTLPAETTFGSTQLLTKSCTKKMNVKTKQSDEKIFGRVE